MEPLENKISISAAIQQICAHIDEIGKLPETGDFHEEFSRYLSLVTDTLTGFFGEKTGYLSKWNSIVLGDEYNLEAYKKWADKAKKILHSAIQDISEKGLVIRTNQEIELNTDGGIVVLGNVNTQGGNFVGRDYVTHIQMDRVVVNASIETNIPQYDRSHQLPTPLLDFVGRKTEFELGVIQMS